MCDIKKWNWDDDIFNFIPKMNKKPIYKNIPTNEIFRLHQGRGWTRPFACEFQKTLIVFQNSKLNIRKSQMYFRNISIQFQKNWAVFQKMQILIQVRFSNVYLRILKYNLGFPEINLIFSEIKLEKVRGMMK